MPEAVANKLLTIQMVTGMIAATVAAIITVLSLTGTHHPARAAQHSNAIAITSLPYKAPASPHAAVTTAHGEDLTGGPQPCSAITNKQSTTGLGYTANQIAQAYNLTSLYQAGDEGAGQTIAVLELEPNNPADITAFQSCYATSATVNYEQVDGGAGTGDGGGEAALDIEQLIATAPQATIDVYQAPNTPTGVLHAFAAMIANPATNIIVTSWGGCEPSNGTLPLGEEPLFKQAATDHITVIAAAGDSGSTDCGTSTLAVDDPASDPYVTGVGGTSLPNPATPSTQTAWNDSASQEGAGGGGVSTLWAMPDWQQQLAADSYQQAIADNNPGCANPNTGGCRTVPDVAADADPYTGYWIIRTDSSTDQQQATLYGGTSAAAPLWAGIVALANASAACNNQALGYLNPTLYQVASTGSYSTDFTDITSGDNNYTPDSPVDDDYQAGTDYDLATGLGTPNVANLTKGLCAAQDQLTVSNPGAQQATVDVTDTINVAATDSDQHALTYSAVDLPQGLNIDASTGQITGTPTTPGTWQATVTATAAATGVHQSITFPIVVATSQTDSNANGSTTSQQGGEGNDTNASQPIRLTRRIHGQLLTIHLTDPGTTTRTVTMRYALADTPRRLRGARFTLTVLEHVRGRTRRITDKAARSAAGFSLRVTPTTTRISSAVLRIQYHLPGHGQHTYTTTVQLTGSINRLV